MEEGEIVTSDSLRKEWEDVLSRFDVLIQNGHALRPIRFIIRHIIEKSYDKVLFPGTSLYSLLISIPTDNKVNYNKTLRIEFDQLTETLKFEFSDWTGLDRQNSNLKKHVLWKETCQATEGCSVIESFFMDNGDFKKTVDRKTIVE